MPTDDRTRVVLEGLANDLREVLARGTERLTQLEGAERQALQKRLQEVGGVLARLLIRIHDDK